MTSELIYRHLCKHDQVERHLTREYPTAVSNEGWCPGGSDEWLDPERVLVIEDEEFGELDSHISPLPALYLAGIEAATDASPYGGPLPESYLRTVHVAIDAAIAALADEGYALYRPADCDQIAWYVVHPVADKRDYHLVPVDLKDDE